MAIQVNPTVSPRIITVPAADGASITIQSLTNQIRNWEDNQANLAYAKLLSASGKEDLGDNVLVGITAKLENARIKFEDRPIPTICIIRGGNLVAVNASGDSMSPIEPATNVSAVLAQSSSATMTQTPIIDEIKTIVDGVKEAIGIPRSTLASDLDEVLAKIQVLPTDPAAESQVETYVDTALGAIKGAGWTEEETLKKIKELVVKSRVQIRV